MACLLIEEKPDEAFEYFSIATSFIASLVRSLLPNLFSESNSHVNFSLKQSSYPAEEQSW